MTPEPRRVVFDCNVLLGAILSTRGAAYRCVQLIDEGSVVLFLSPFVLQELRRTPFHPDLRRFTELTPPRVEAFIKDLLPKATLMETVSPVFEYPRDPKDANYINLALAVNAVYVVSRDNDLLDLMDPSRSEARDFQMRFPHLRIIEPQTLIREVEGQPG